MEDGLNEEESLPSSCIKKVVEATDVVFVPVALY